jgi:cation:H+ antiporter
LSAEVDFLTPVLFVAGFGLLVLGAELLVRGAARLAAAAGVSALVIGLTVVAYGTSAPELAVTVLSTCGETPQPDIAVGNVVGSNIANVLLVLGLAAAFAPLVVSHHLVRIGVPLMIAVSVLMLVMGLDGRINRLEGILLVLGSVTYTAVAVTYSRRRHRASQAEAEVNDEPKGRGAALGETLLQLLLIAVGLGMLVLGSKWLIDGAVKLAEWLGVSKLIIGLTIVAIGTSLPEVATSVVASIRGQRDIAVGNVVGSNLFNILLVLGACGVVAPDGVHVSPAALRFDIPVMIVVAVACLPVFFSDYSIARWEGVVFLVYYAAYLTYLCLAATEHDALEGFKSLMGLFVIPLTLLTLTIYWYRVLMRKRREGS